MRQEIIKNKMEGMFYIQAKNCVLNGSPDAENMQRTDDETGKGFITDVAIKRRIRDYVMAAYGGKEGMDIVMQTSCSLNRKISEIYDDIGEDKKTGKKKTELAAKRACEKFWDVRTFGAVLTTGKNAGQITGPVQFEIGESLDPVYNTSMTITRMCVAGPKDSPSMTTEELREWEDNEPQDKLRTMGRRAFTPYGLYCVKFFISANDAEKTGFSEQDFDILCEAILNAFENCHSASKTEISVVSPLIIFKHIGTEIADAESRAKECKLGCYPAYRLFETVSVRKKEDVEYPRYYTDYEARIHTSEIPKEVTAGFKKYPFAPFTWGKLPEGEKWFKEY